MGRKILEWISILDVEEKSEAAASAEGPVDEVFLVEKQLVLKFLRSLAPDDDGTLTRCRSCRPLTLLHQANHRGVMALDQNDKELARTISSAPPRRLLQSAHSISAGPSQA